MTADQEVSYAHKGDPKGCRFVQLAKDKLPVWAVDSQPHKKAVPVIRDPVEALRRIIESTRGYSRWEGTTAAERELINAIGTTIKAAGEALGVDPDLVGTPLDPALASRKPLIPDRKPQHIGRKISA